MRGMNLEARLKEATQEPVLSELKGETALFAVTRSELLYVGPEEVQRAPLKEIRRVSSAKGGKLVIASKEAPLIEASIAGFDLGELKLFFEGVKGYVGKARRGELTAVQEPASPEAAEPPPMPMEPQAPAPEPEPLTAATEPPPPAPTEAPDRPPLVPEEEAAPAVEGPPSEPQPAANANPLRIPLKLLAVLTLAYTVGFYFLFPEADPWLLTGVILGGLGLTLVEWKAADL